MDYSSFLWGLVHESFFWGFLGGAFEELLHWVALRRRAAFPTYWRQLRYWAITALLVLGGGLVAFLFAISVSVYVTPLLAFVVGLSAPAFVKKLSKVFLTSGTLGAASGQASVKSFLMD